MRPLHIRATCTLTVSLYRLFDPLATSCAVGNRELAIPPERTGACAYDCFARSPCAIIPGEFLYGRNWTDTRHLSDGGLQRAFIDIRSLLCRRAFHQIDGTTNPLLQALHVPDLPLRTAAFHPSGSSVLLSGSRPYLYAYDLQSGRTTRSSPWRAGGATADETERDLSFARFQPSSYTHDGKAGTGRLLAVGGRRGNVHLLDWGSGGAAGGAVVGSLRMNAPLAGMAWAPAGTGTGHELATVATDGAVHIWDVRARRCLAVRRDPDSFGVKGLESSPDGKHWSVG